MANGILDVNGGAEFLGKTSKALRKDIERRTVPFRRMGGRIVLLRDELESYVRNLDGCQLDEALENAKTRTRTR